MRVRGGGCPDGAAGLLVLARIQRAGLRARAQRAGALVTLAELAGRHPVVRIEVKMIQLGYYVLRMYRGT